MFQLLKIWKIKNMYGNVKQDRLYFKQLNCHTRML